jgi:hypothetical protein
MLFEYLTVPPVIKISCVNDRFDIIKDKFFHCFFNGNAVLSSKSTDEYFGSVVGMLVRSSIQVPNAPIVIKAENTFSDQIKSIIDMINKSKQEKINVLEEKPDELMENKPSEYPMRAESINKYQENLKSFTETYEDAVNLSEVLLKTSFPKTMWGAKELNGCLSKMKTASAELVSNIEIFETAAEQTDFRMNHLVPCLSGKISSHKRAEDSINHIVTNFLTMKRMMASYLQSFHRLYASDQLFKKYTGYPATWFFDPSVFFNFMERYEDVSDNLIEASRAESAVIRPLYAWKIKVMGA